MFAGESLQFIQMEFSINRLERTPLGDSSGIAAGFLGSGKLNAHDEVMVVEPHEMHLCWLQFASAA
ncbi:MAG: hypothetical protein IPI67_38685 [Myxococcales bacterium]|nr:hypothetical protein [Myxococcales bacterium]